MSSFGVLFSLTFASYFVVKQVNKDRKRAYAAEHALDDDKPMSSHLGPGTPVNDRVRPMSPFQSLMYNLERNWNQKVKSSS